MIELQDIIKPGIQERFERLSKMGVKTVMVTGDNPLTAKYIAEKAGVDDYIAEAKPEDKMNYIRKEQENGKLVAMMGDGTNDAPALAQANVGVAMNSGTQAANAGIVTMNRAGTIAKYLATSLAILKVVSVPRVISNCLPISTISISFVGSLSKSTILPASLAACVPLFIATPTFA